MHTLKKEHTYAVKSTEELILNKQYFLVQTFVGIDLVSLLSLISFFKQDQRPFVKYKYIPFGYSAI